MSGHVVFHIPIGTPINATLISSMNHYVSTSTSATTLCYNIPQQSTSVSASVIPNGAVLGGGTCKLGVTSLMEQVMLLNDSEFSDFMFKVMGKKYPSYIPGTDAFAHVQAELDKAGYVLPSGQYYLPDGATLTITYNSNYWINDKDAKVTYASNKNRDFNEYVNVSDILDQFMKYAADLKLTRAQFLAIPIQTFLMWLIIEASKKDGEIPPENDVKQLEFALASPG